MNLPELTTADLIREGRRMREQLISINCPCRTCVRVMQQVESMLAQLEEMEASAGVLS